MQVFRWSISLENISWETIFFNWDKFKEKKNSEEPLSSKNRTNNSTVILNLKTMWKSSISLFFKACLGNWNKESDKKKREVVEMWTLYWFKIHFSLLNEKDPFCLLPPRVSFAFSSDATRQVFKNIPWGCFRYWSLWSLLLWEGKKMGGRKIYFHSKNQVVWMLSRTWVSPWSSQIL